MKRTASLWVQAILITALSACLIQAASAGPQITSVQFSGSAGNYTLTINGSGFGSLPSTLPFTGDSSYFRIADAAQIGFGEWGYSGDALGLTYQSWSDTQIVVSGFGGQPGDAIVLGAWNPGSGIGVTWGGNVPGGGVGTPQITSVTFSGSGQNLQIIVHGSGFGNAPVSMPFTGNLNYFIFDDARTHCDGSSLFEAGTSAWGYRSDSVTLNYQSWSDTEIVINGFAGSYGQGCNVVQSGDPVTIEIWNTSDTGQTGPQTAWGGFASVLEAGSVSLFTPCINGLQVDLNGGAFPGASVTSIVWNWGDGQQTTGFFPQSHIYASQGSYSIQVTAHYNDGSSASASQTVNVAPGVRSGCAALTISAGQGGTVSYQASVGTGTVLAGGSVTLQLDYADDLSLTANPGSGGSFVNWSASSGITGPGGAPVATTSPSILIVVNSSSQIAASFSAPAQGIMVTVNAPEQVDMGSKYCVDVNITGSGSWQGGTVNLTVDENRGAIQATWDIHDNEYCDWLTQQCQPRPEADCNVYVWNAGKYNPVQKYECGTDSISLPLYVPAGGTAKCRFEAYHQWYWIPPWDYSRVVSILEGFLPDVGDLISDTGLVDDFITALKGQHEISYTYTAYSQGNVSSDTTIVKVPPTKYIDMGFSLSSSIAGSVATDAGIPLIEIPVGWALLASEAALIVASESSYIIASDPPDFNYTEIAVPQVPVIPELDQITDANQREAAEQALQLAAYQGALLKSLERYDGAKIDGKPQYMALQMGAATLYGERIRELATSLRDFWCPVSATLPIPTTEQIQQARQNLLQNGLPEIEVNILSAFGYSSEQMTEIATATASLPDEWFTSPETICIALGSIVESVSQNLPLISGPEVNIIFPQSGQVAQDGVTLTAEVNDLNIVDAVYFYIGEPNNENGIPTAYTEFSAIYDSNSGHWKYQLDTTQLPDGYYVVFAKAVDTYGNVGWSQVVPFRIHHPPIANAGPDQTVYAWIDGVAEVNLDGSGSYDDDNDTLIYKWNWTIDGNDFEANGVKPTIELPVGQYVISLIVNDGLIDSEPNEVNITVIGPVEANLCVMPKVLNSKSFMPRIMAMMWLPKGITENQIDSNDPILLYPGEIVADKVWISRGIDWRTTIFASFDKDELMDAINSNGLVELVVVGQLKTGQYFYGSDTINVICPGTWPHHKPWWNCRWNRWCKRPFNCRH